MKKILTVILFLSIVFISGKFLISTAEAREQKVFATGDCVINTAAAEGFNDPYSQEAWTLFSSQCSK